MNPKAGEKQGENQAPAMWIHGSSGRMGREIQEQLVENPGSFRLVGGSSRKFEGEIFHQGKKVTKDLLAHALEKDRVDLVVDFSNPEANQVLLDAFVEGNLKKKAVLLGTTGIEADVLLRWKSLAEANILRLLIAPNTSVGILLLMKAALEAAKVLTPHGFDIEIVESHHRGKKDSPSGTAHFLARTMIDGIDGLKLAPPHREGARQEGEVGVHAIRGGSVFGEHTIRIMGEHEELSFSHRALSRTLFAQGALNLASWLIKQQPGAYGLMDISLGKP